MGKKNKSKSKQERIYISPPTDNKAHEFIVGDYDPQTQVHDPFEDDLDFLLQTDSHIDAIATTTIIDEEVTKPIPKYKINGQSKSTSPAPVEVNVTKKLKKEILNFDITFSSDESDSESDEEDTGKAIRDIDSERYMKAELGLHSSDSEDLEDDDVDMDVVAELYEQLQIDDEYDPVRSEYFDEKGISKELEESTDEKKKKKIKSKKSKAVTEPNIKPKEKPDIIEPNIKSDGPSKSTKRRERRKKARRLEKANGNDGKKTDGHEVKYDNKLQDLVSSRGNEGREVKRDTMDQKDSSSTKKASKGKKELDKRDISRGVTPEAKSKKKVPKSDAKKRTDEQKQTSGDQLIRSKADKINDSKPQKPKKERSTKENGSEGWKKSSRDGTPAPNEAEHSAKNESKKKANKRSAKNESNGEKSEVNNKSKMDQLQDTIEKRMLELKKMRDEALPHVL